MISFDEFQKIDLRVAEILSAERVPNTDKLLQLRVSLGDEERTLVAGIAANYAPEDIIGFKVIIVANLEPATIKGIESNGMILAVRGGDDGLALLTTNKPAPNGGRVG